MDSYEPSNKDSILAFAKKLKGKTLRQVINNSQILEIEETEAKAKLKSTNNNKSINKGSFGQKLEKYYFGLANNSNKEADFNECKLELKITPLKEITLGRLRPKERMVCNIINFEEIINEEWQTSSFLAKCNEILLIRYVDPLDKMISHLDYKFVDVRINNILKSADSSQFESDWNMIVDKIKSGYAHELSESDTVFLGACPKGANNKSLRSQPNSNIPAMQRAFTFKTQYMKVLLDRAPEIYEVHKS